MTVHNDQHSPFEDTHSDQSTHTTELQDMLDEAQSNQQTSQDQTTIAMLEAKILQLETQLRDQTEIAKKAQSDYIHMKFDFEGLVRRTDESNKTMKVDTLVDVVKKFAPFIDSLRTSLDNIPADERDNALVQWVQMVYNKFLTTLENMGIKAIESLGLEPNHELHEAVSAMPTDDPAMKGKIIQEFEKGFIYEKWDIRKVVTTAKVVVGQ